MQFSSLPQDTQNKLNAEGLYLKRLEQIEDEQRHKYFEVTQEYKNGKYDLSNRAGRFVKEADPADAEWQGFVEQPQPTTGKKLKPNAVAEKWRKTATALGFNFLPVVG